MDTGKRPIVVNFGLYQDEGFYGRRFSKVPSKTISLDQKPKGQVEHWVQRR